MTKKYQDLNSRQKTVILTLLKAFFTGVSNDEIRDYIDGYTDLDVILDPEEINELLSIFKLN